MQQRPVDSTEGNPSPQGGFGLVEVLVALIILSVGLLGVGGLALVASQHTTRASTRTGQEIAAQSVLEEFVRQGYAELEDETTSGPSDTTVSVKGISYTVTKDVEQVSFRVRRLVVEVASENSTAAVSRTTRIAKP